MSDTIDFLQIKIEKAKGELPAETRKAIDSVNWKSAILGLRAKRGYTFEQLGDLELETELMLCGLVSPENYPSEISKRLGISKEAADGIANEMNDLVFKKIREELIKNTERRMPEEEKIQDIDDAHILDSAGIKVVPDPLAVDVRMEELQSREDMLKKIENPASTHIKEPMRGEPATPASNLPEKEIHSILAQKLSGPVQTPTIKTEHTLENITKISALPVIPPQPDIPKTGYKSDPYREVPE